MMCICPTLFHKIFPWAPASQGHFSPPSCFFDSLFEKISGARKPAVAATVTMNRLTRLVVSHLLFLILAGRSGIVRPNGFKTNHEIPQGFSHWTLRTTCFANNSPWFGRNWQFLQSDFEPHCITKSQVPMIISSITAMRECVLPLPKNLFKPSVSNTCHSEEWSRISTFPKWFLLKLGQSLPKEEKALASAVADKATVDVWEYVSPHGTKINWKSSTSSKPCWISAPSCSVFLHPSKYSSKNIWTIPPIKNIQKQPTNITIPWLENIPNVGLAMNPWSTSPDPLKVHIWRS